MKRFVLLAVLLALAIPNVARANELDRFLQVADTYWDDHGVIDNCPTVLRVVELPGWIGQARLYDCWIELDARYVKQRLRTVRNRWEARSYRLAMAVELCALVIHEEGHARGLLHSPDGVMAEGYQTDAPEECYRAARPMVRTRRGRLTSPRSRTESPDRPDSASSASNTR